MDIIVLISNRAFNNALSYSPTRSVLIWDPDVR